MIRNSILSKTRIDAAAGRAAAVEEQLQKESEESRRAFERFYTNLALFAGGTIALSVTYLGYLKSTPNSVLGVHMLVASWCALIICAACSLFCPFLHAYYMHFARHREYCQKRMTQRKTEEEALPYMPIVNLRSPGEREDFRARLKQLADSYERDASWAEKRETYYWHMWNWSGRVARIGFVAGLTLLVAFAVGNT